MVRKMASATAAVAPAPQSHIPTTLNASGPPPGHCVTVGNLQTFILPDKVSDTEENHKLGEALVDAWQKDGILQISMTPEQHSLYKSANYASKRFFGKPYAQKAACVDSQTYSGYIASGEELTDGIADYTSQPLTRLMARAKKEEESDLTLTTDFSSLPQLMMSEATLMIRPPYSDEKLANWEVSAAGFKEDDERWVFVPPAENVFTVFPGKFALPA
ncbi:2-oxoglutarate-dependent ethylene succinate-forming enzyme [Fusarium tjaetaba]|uniref:2-oxoglutarate-dependent ethylene succinate-forming enzyme n=1 Tax=Fusarium tjaetaba TaxID=1567544 RepID=A0A8H5W1C8_9HYPO|nr:2-oxoglutarate-dependent ethylene succinate-forming enzyme [Fusarium tjaetaba]KAF5641763.1 2-oxoglutarate-dependent ethylene succinate-forming enzyme [Fusarium tjaetaba]